MENLLLTLLNRRFYSALTTQEVLTNHKLLREMAMAGCQSAVMEVSSHGLDQGRVDEIEFDAGIFTNLYPDHLDYHKTMEAYAAAKRELFQKVKERAIINVDNPWTAFMREGCKAPVWTFGLEKKADLMADRVVFTSRGTEFEVKWKGQCYLFKTSLIGRHNVYNLLGAIAVGLHKGLSIEEIRNRLDSFRAVPGRLEPVQNDLGLRIYVDFAHNGEALENVLKTVREISEGRVIVVFGC